MIDRSAGILLPVFSLPSAYGMGSIGAAAREFVDFLAEAGQRWWQILPVVPAGGGNSPYSSICTHAGDPMLIDPELLLKDGLVTAEDLAAARMPDTGRVDYSAVRAARTAILRRAFAVGYEKDVAAVRAFEEENRWVRPYALYMAARAYFGDKPWLEWPEKDLRNHEWDAVEYWSQQLADEIAYHIYVQYLFDRQWAQLKQYANSKGVGIIGDLPIYISLDSSDIWAEREQFELDETGHPLRVAGVPPDYFCEDGQLWGNPLYNWDVMRADGYGWWIRRVDSAARRFDAIRIDHFRALESYWAVPVDAETAKAGAWNPGPGMSLAGVLTGWFSGVQFIAEDLGDITPAVTALVQQSGMPGMRVLQFAFTNPGNAYLPHNYQPNTICYTGTHDNNTLAGWYAEAKESELKFARQYLGVDGAEETRRAMLRAGMGSVASLFVAQLQDYLGLGAEGRINVPGVAKGNWEWRLRDGQLPRSLAKEIRALTATYSRCAPEEEKQSEAEPAPTAITKKDEE